MIGLAADTADSSGHDRPQIFMGLAERAHGWMKLSSFVSEQVSGNAGPEPVNLYETAVRTIYWVELA